MTDGKCLDQSVRGINPGIATEARLTQLNQRDLWIFSTLRINPYTWWCLSPAWNVNLNKNLHLTRKSDRKRWWSLWTLIVPNWGPWLTREPKGTLLTRKLKNDPQCDFRSQVLNFHLTREFWARCFTDTRDWFDCCKRSYRCSDVIYLNLRNHRLHELKHDFTFPSISMTTTTVTQSVSNTWLYPDYPESLRVCLWQSVQPNLREMAGCCFWNSDLLHTHATKKFVSTFYRRTSRISYGWAVSKSFTQTLWRPRHWLALQGATSITRSSPSIFLWIREQGPLRNLSLNFLTSVL